MSSASRLSQVRSALPAGQVGQGPAGLDEPGLGAGPDREVGEGLGDVALADADRAVEDDGLAGGQPAQGGEVADLGGGQLRGGAEVEALEGGLGLEPGAADPALQGHGLAAGDLVLAQDLQEVQVAEFPGVRLGEAGVEGVQHAGQFQVPQRGGQRAAVGDGDGGHDAASWLTGVKMCTGCPANVPRAQIQPQVRPGWGSGAGSHPVRAASRATLAVRDGVSPAGLGDLDDDLVRLRPDGQAGDAGLLDQVRGGADDAHVGGQRDVPARGGGGHGVISAASPGRTASLVTVPGKGMTLANDAGPRRNAAAPPSPAAAGSWSRSVAGGQDALDRPVGRVAGGDRLGAGGLEPGRVVLVGQPDHALGGAEPVERVVGQQLADDLLAGRADPGGLAAAPGRGPHVERDLLRRVVAEVGLLARGPCAGGS